MSKFFLARYARSIRISINLFWHPPCWILHTHCAAVTFLRDLGGCLSPPYTGVKTYLWHIMSFSRCRVVWWRTRTSWCSASSYHRRDVSSDRGAVKGLKNASTAACLMLSFQCVTAASPVAVRIRQFLSRV